RRPHRSAGDRHRARGRGPQRIFSTFQQRPGRGLLSMRGLLVGSIMALVGSGAVFGGSLAMGQSWDAVARPSIGPAQIFGGYANGCIAGAVQLPVDGRGYEVVRVSRNRF